MKIAFIGQKGIFGKSGGGVESQVEDLALNLAKKGHNVFVYIRQYYCRVKVDKIRKYKGITLIKLPTIKTKHLDAFTHTFLASIDILRRDVDIIHYHSIGPASLLWIPKLLKRKARVVFTYYSQDYYHKKWGRLAKFYLKLGERIGCCYADEVIIASKSIKKYVYEKYNIIANFIPNGVKVPDLVRPNHIKKWGLKKNEYVLCIARMIPHKNIHLLIGAYNKITWRTRSKKLVVVGGGTYTDLYVKYLNHSFGKNKNIIFTGQLPSGLKIIKELYSNAYLYVHPSESEGLSVSLLEAGSFGLPVLASDIAENRDVLEDNGFYFKNKSLGDLKNKLEYLVHNKVVLTDKKRLFKKNVGSVYNWEGLVKKITYVYLVARKKNSGHKTGFEKVVAVKGR